MTIVSDNGQGAGADGKFWGAALYSPREAHLVLSDCGLIETAGGGAVLFLLSGRFAVDVAVVFCCCCCVVVSCFVAVVVR